MRRRKRRRKRRQRKRRRKRRKTAAAAAAASLTGSRTTGCNKWQITNQGLPQGTQIFILLSVQQKV